MQRVTVQVKIIGKVIGIKFNIGHFGAAFNHDGNGSYKGGTFTVTLNRTNDFFNNSFYDGRDTTSIIDNIIWRSNGFHPDKLGDFDWAAYELYLINPVYDSANDFTEYYMINLTAILKTKCFPR